MQGCFGTWDTGLGLRALEFGTPASGTWGTACGTWDTGLWDLGYWLGTPGFKTWDTALWDLGYRLSGLETLGLGKPAFGNWGIEIRDRIRT